MNLKELFDTRILERGRDYCKHSLVTDLHRDGNTIIASVAGSEDYEVIITLENSEPTDLYCSCPYAADGHNCKHMAAVLLAFDEKTECAAMHAARISVPTGLHLDRNAGEINIAAYRKRIKATIRQFSDRHGFIDYDSAPDFLNAMEEYLEHDVLCLTETGHIAEAFALCNLLFQAFSEADIDDDGELSQFAGDVVDAWGEIIECADATQKNEMFKWFMSHLNGCYSDFMEEYQRKRHASTGRGFL